MTAETPILESLVGHLTRQQRRVLLLLCEGRTNKQIADEFGLKESTIKIHVKGILRRLGVQSRTQAVLLLCQSIPQRESPLRDFDADRALFARLHLRERERDVLLGIRQGLLNKQIAFRLGVSHATVKAHVSEILRKLGVSSRTQLVIEVSNVNLNALRLGPLRNDVDRRLS